MTYAAFIDSFSKLSSMDKKVYLQKSVDEYQRRLTGLAASKQSLYALLDFMGQKNEKNQRRSTEMKRLLEQLKQTVEEIAEEQRMKEETEK